ncbi:MAG: NADP-dependent malic enzyme [Anaplasmataceae bacterium]|nr:NADP-dependent malic enzyme [Anaplasmataceae bacterium]
MLKNHQIQEILDYHQNGKLEIRATKPILTQEDLSIAYSPGVAVACNAIEKDPSLASQLTTKGSMIAVITNGTAVLGLGNIGVLAAKPVMEGKAVLFKRFANINAIDVAVDAQDIDQFIDSVACIANNFAGINLEDIKSPDCFIIEQKLKEKLNIPVFHDDQHGTAITILAALFNACEIQGKDIYNIQIVLNGPGAAGIACIELLKGYGIKNIIACDQNGVICNKRSLGMNDWKKKHAIEHDPKLKTLSDALKGADVFIGLSVKNVLNKEMLESMNKNPIVFGLANPDPEVLPSFAKSIRKDIIVATGRSDFNNQLNNVMCFPYIFRGAIDIKATAINTDMKIAAAKAIASIAKEPLLYEISQAYSKQNLSFGPEYILPTPFDPRLLTNVPHAVAKAGIESNVNGDKDFKLDSYKSVLSSSFSNITNLLNILGNSIRDKNIRIILAEGEEPKMIQAALKIKSLNYGIPILIGKKDKIAANLKIINGNNSDNSITIDDLEIVNSAISEHNEKYIDYLYSKLQRKGGLKRTCIREVKTDRNVFASCMIACGDADTMITGLTREYSDVLKILSDTVEKEKVLFGLSVLYNSKKVIFIADTSVNHNPNGEQLAEISKIAANRVKKLGYTPRVAFISFSTFGSVPIESHAKDALKILDNDPNIDFEYEGELSVDVALDKETLQSTYPFSRLTDSANILIMPDLNSANISVELVKNLSNTQLIGPILTGFKKPCQIVSMHSDVAEIFRMAILAASEAL